MSRFVTIRRQIKWKSYASMHKEKLCRFGNFPVVLWWPLKHANVRVHVKREHNACTRVWQRLVLSRSKNTLSLHLFLFSRILYKASTVRKCCWEEFFPLSVRTKFKTPVLSLYPVLRPPVSVRRISCPLPGEIKHSWSFLPQGKTYFIPLWSWNF